MEDNTEKCTICLSDFEDTEDVRYVFVHLILYDYFEVNGKIVIM